MVTSILSRLLSIFAALAILLASAAASPRTRDGSVAMHAATAIESSPALVTAQFLRLAIKPAARGSFRVCAGADLTNRVPRSASLRVPADGRVERPADAGSFVGYDATAPPSPS